MSFYLLFRNLTDSEILTFIYERNIPASAHYTHYVFQPPKSSDDHGQVYNPDRQVDTFNDKLTCHYFELDNKDIEKTGTSTGPNSCLTLTL